MSAFMVGDKTLRTVLLGMTPRFTEAAGEREQLFVQLWRMNFDAVTERYGEADGDPDGAANPVEFHFDYRHMGAAGVDKVAVAKAMQCFLYQCDEGDISGRPLFQLVKARLFEILLEIVAETPAYKAAAWNDE